MDINKLCLGCMKEIGAIGSSKFCPVCGYNLQEDTTAPHQLRPKSILNGKYIVGKVIGEGGFGITYLGFDLNLEIPVAIKEYYPNGFVTRDSMITSSVTAYAGKNMEEFNKWRENFLKEARSLAKFSNLSGIVEVRDYFTENNTTYIVMEFVDGITMKEFLKSQGGKLPTETVLHYMQPIIRSLGKVHATGIIHRDISPDNIMMEKSGEMKLLDFGAARDISSNAEKSLSVLLKPGYAPEEQYRTRGNQGMWSDVYAICATIYKCITGVTPVESMERLRNDTLKMPSELGVGIYPHEEAALKKGLAVYSEDRFQTMEELYDALYIGVGGSTSTAQYVSPVKGANTGTKQTIDPVTGVHTGAITTGRSIGGISDAASMVNNENEKNKTVLLIIAGGVAICVLIIVGVLALSGTGSEPSMEIPTGEYVAKQEEEFTSEVVANTGLPEVDSAQLDEIESKFNNAGEINTKYDAMNQLCDFAETNEMTESLRNRVTNLSEAYYESLMAYIQVMNNYNPSSDYCMEISNRFSDTISIYERLQNVNISVDSGKIKNKRAEINEEYKKRWINFFDLEANDEINNTGVVSRSTLWTLIEGADSCNLFDSQDYHDELRQRYIAALTLHVDSELDNKGSDQERIALIYEQLEATDYSPYLVYKLMTYGDANGQYMYEQIRNTLNTIGADFDYLSVEDQRNAIYLYNSDGAYVGARDKIRNALLQAKDELGL